MTSELPQIADYFAIYPSTKIQHSPVLSSTCWYVMVFSSILVADSCPLSDPCNSKLVVQWNQPKDYTWINGFCKDKKKKKKKRGNDRMKQHKSDKNRRKGMQ